VVAPEGTQTTIFVALQLVGVALVPLNLTVLVPCVEPKFDPVMVMQFPTAPDDADSALMLGGAFVTVKLTPLLARPPTVTTTLPVLAPLGTEVPILVALQLVAVAVIPLNVTVLDPWADPKLVPETVTGVPIVPELGESPVIEGVEDKVSLKMTPLLASPPTVTMTGPVVAPLGTATTMLVALQAVGVANTPLNVTVLVP